MTHEELVYDFKSIKDITGPDVPVLIEYAINSNITLSDAINLREILSVKINEYKNTLIDKYQKAVNEVAHKRGIDFMPIPNKHLIYIENKIKFYTINLCGNFDLIIAGFQGEDTHVLSKSQEEDMKLLKRRIFNFDNELKNKHYTLDDVSRERRTHTKYIIESEKIGREIGPEVYAQLNSLDLLEEDIKIKHPISSISNTSNQFKKFTYSHIALICHYAKICDSEGKMSLLIHLDIPGKKTITRKLNEKISKFTIKDNRINFEGGNKAGLERQKLLTEVISYLKFHELKTDEAESDLALLEESLDPDW